MEPPSGPALTQGLVTATFEASPRSIHTLLSNHGPEHVIALLTSEETGPITAEIINALFHLVRAAQYHSYWLE